MLTAIRSTWVGDGVGRLLTRRVTMEDGRVLETRYEYDAKGLQYRVTDPKGVVTQYEYDLKGQIKANTRCCLAGGFAINDPFDYDARGNTISVTKPMVR